MKTVGIYDPLGTMGLLDDLPSLSQSTESRVNVTRPTHGRQSRHPCQAMHNGCMDYCMP